MRQWVKLYTESNRDVKIGTLSWAQRGIWAALLALAGDLDHEDANGQATGQLDTLENVAWDIRCSVEELKEAVAEFIKRKMVDERDGVLFVTNYGKRNPIAPSESRGATRERKRDQREREKVSQDVTSASRDVTDGSRTVTSLEKSREEQSREEQSRQEQQQTRAHVVAAVAELTCEHPEVCKDFAEKDLVRLRCAGADRLAVMRGPRFAGCWCYAADQDPNVKNPGAFVAGMIRQGISPPIPPPDWDGWSVYCAGECAGSGPVENGREDWQAEQREQRILYLREYIPKYEDWLAKDGLIREQDRESYRSTLEEYRAELAELEGAT